MFELSDAHAQAALHEAAHAVAAQVLGAPVVNISLMKTVTGKAPSAAASAIIDLAGGVALELTGRPADFSPDDMDRAIRACSVAGITTDDARDAAKALLRDHWDQVTQVADEVLRRYQRETAQMAVEAASTLKQSMPDLSDTAARRLATKTIEDFYRD